MATWRSGWPRGDLGARSVRGHPESDSSCESDFSSEYMLNLWPRGDLGGHVAIWGRASCAGSERRARPVFHICCINANEPCAPCICPCASVAGPRRICSSGRVHCGVVVSLCISARVAYPSCYT